jgi:hypothetical protein
MSTGNLLYLLMTIGVFTGFSFVLAYVSWQQSKSGPDMTGARMVDARQHDGEARHGEARHGDARHGDAIHA